MTTVRTPAAARGRIDKRRAILDAAFTVFSRAGYGQACVKEIAAEAGVAKPTVYNHLTDKATLFREAMAAAAESALAADLAALEPLHEPVGGTGDGVGGDVPAALTRVARELLRRHATAEAWALRRLLHAELTQFPDLLDTVRGDGTRRLGEALADRFARLMLAGRLRAADPAVAAEQFLALLDGPLEARSAMGTRRLRKADLDALADAAVETFLRAFGPES
ncbi:TetR/AcrR family transcriptional regulator [Actinomadura kijaniata]|uniref:TetR/AcrR family transcriptional regulator n=1 Tax=Actinomadura kijaniata TaxID=46161 RepID=UPI00082BA3B6|nr:TetR/AcrR family transcriptional regulator [Actinomadura kijaniata]